MEGGVACFYYLPPPGLQAVRPTVLGGQVTRLSATYAGPSGAAHAWISSEADMSDCGRAGPHWLGLGGRPRSRMAAPFWALVQPRLAEAGGEGAISPHHHTHTTPPQVAESGSPRSTCIPKYRMYSTYLRSCSRVICRQSGNSTDATAPPAAPSASFVPIVLPYCLLASSVSGQQRNKEALAHA